MGGILEYLGQWDISVTHTYTHVYGAPHTHTPPQILFITVGCAPGGVSHGCNADCRRASREANTETGVSIQGCALCQANQEGKKGRHCATCTLYLFSRVKYVSRGI